MKYFIDQIKHYQINEPDVHYSTMHSRIVVVHQHIAPDLMAFLEKMLGAFGWPLEQCHHLTWTGEESDDNYRLLWGNKNVKLVLSFGVPFHSIGIFSLAKPYTITSAGSCMLYSADALEKIAPSKDLKSRIWNDLKSLNIKEIS